MSLRLIREDEILEARKISTLAFFGKLSLDEPLEEERRQRYLNNLAATFDDDGKMTAVVANLPLKMMLDGGEAACGGIAGVGSLAASRGGGRVRALMGFWLEKMRQDRWPLTYLYPFSVEFYRKFGYEICCEERQVAGVSPEALLPYGRKMRVVMLEPEMTEIDQGIRTCYSRFIRDKNIAVIRDDQRWKSVTGRSPYTDRQYVYAALDAAGMVRGYATLSILPHESKPAHEWDQYGALTELAYDNVDALETLLSVVRSLGAQIKKLNMILPTGLPPEMIFAPYRGVSINLRTMGMGRVTDPAETLKMLKARTQSGCCTIRTTDNMVERNNTVLRVMWEDGRVREAAPAEGQPDITLPVGRLAQLAFGFRALSDMSVCRDVVIHRETDDLHALFPGKKTMLWDHF